MDQLKSDLPQSMTISAFVGVAWYIGVEVLISLFLLFQRWTGLYFWSCLIGACGLILQALFVILADYGVWKDLKGSITMIYLTWVLMVIPQSWTLYSRLHLIMHKPRLLWHIRNVLLFTSIVIPPPTIVVGVMAQVSRPEWLHFNSIWDRFQICVYFAQELCLSLLYIWETRNFLRSSSFLSSSSGRQAPRGDGADARSRSRVFWQLIYANILVICLDIALIAFYFGNTNLFYLMGAFKPCAYAVKLKVEFIVLNRLIKTIRARSHHSGSGAYKYPTVHSTGGDATLLSSQPVKGPHGQHAVQDIGEVIHLDNIDKSKPPRPAYSREGQASMTEDVEPGVWDGTQGNLWVR